MKVPQGNARRNRRKVLQLRAIVHLEVLEHGTCAHGERQPFQLVEGPQFELEQLAPRDAVLHLPQLYIT